jgi:hypothetical protein
MDDFVLSNLFVYRLIYICVYTYFYSYIISNEIYIFIIPLIFVVITT